MRRYLLLAVLLSALGARAEAAIVSGTGYICNLKYVPPGISTVDGTLGAVKLDIYEGYSTLLNRCSGSPVIRGILKTTGATTGDPNYFYDAERLNAVFTVLKTHIEDADSFWNERVPYLIYYQCETTTGQCRKIIFNY